MQQRAAGVAVLPLLLTTILISGVHAENFLEIGFDRYEASGSAVLYEAFLEANKDGATTCELVTPLGTYSCVDVGGRFRPENDFFTDHMDVDFAGLQTVISADWILTWDAGAAQTVATIEFGAISESDFLPIPILTAPVDGDSILTPPDPNPPTIEWDYAPTDPCDAQLGEVIVFLADHEMWWNANTVIVSSELPCNTTSWTPTSPLADGSWLIVIQNGIDHLVPSGISVVEGTWPIENPTGWFALGSRGKSRNEVVDGTVAAEPTSWGGLKRRFTAVTN